MTEDEDKQTVLIAIDGSAQASYAFESYIANIHQSNTKVILMHVREPNIQAHVHTSGAILDKLLEVDAEETKELEDHYTGILKHLNIDGHFEMSLATNPGEVICRRAMAARCSLIVVGSRGHGKIRRTILGSVSEFILHHAHCPIMVCSQEGAGISNVCGPI